MSDKTLDELVEGFEHTMAIANTKNPYVIRTSITALIRLIASVEEKTIADVFDELKEDVAELDLANGVKYTVEL